MLRAFKVEDTFGGLNRRIPKTQCKRGKNRNKGWEGGHHNSTKKKRGEIDGETRHHSRRKGARSLGVGGFQRGGGGQKE